VAACLDLSDDSRSSRRLFRSYLEAHDEKRARELLDAALTLLGLGGPQLTVMNKGDVRKQALGWLIHTQTTMKQSWILERLYLGHRSTLHKAIQRFKKSRLEPEVERLKQLLHKLKT